MTTCLNVILSAFRRSGVKPTSQGTLAVVDQTLGLERLNGMYMKWLGSGLFGTLEPYYLSSGDYTAKENQWVTNAGVGAITFPTTVVDCGTGLTRAPLDGTVVVVAKTGVTPVFKVYDALLADWIPAYSLIQSSQAPFGNRFEEAIKDCLGLELCDEYGQAPSARLIRNAGMGQLSIASRPRGKIAKNVYF